MSEPTRAEVDAWTGPSVLAFGARWCGHCQAVLPRIEALVQSRPGLGYVWVEDGPGQPLGRSFAVKLWPTVVLLRDGAVVARLVRPSLAELETAFAQLDAER